MHALRLRGSTALIALSLALALPAPLAAQDTPAATQPAPLTWTEVERFGLRFGVVAGAEVTDDTDTALSRAFAASTTGPGDIGIRMGVRVLMGPDLQEVPLADPDALVDFMSEITGVPMAATGGFLALGGRMFDIYTGTGTREAEGGPIDTRMLFLVAQDLDAQGHGMMIAVYSGGQGAEAAAQIEAEFVTRLGVVPESPTEAPNDTESEPEPQVTTAPTPDTESQTATDTAPGSEPAPETAAEASPSERLPVSAVEAEAMDLLAAILPEPAGTIPLDWRGVEAFGYRFAMPGGDAVEVSTDDLYREFNALLDNPDAGTAVQVGVLQADAQRLEQLGIAPDTSDFAAVVERNEQVPVRETDRRVMLGGQPLRLSLAASQPGDAQEVLGFLLAAEAPDADGRWLLVLAFYEGFDPDDARAGLAAVMAGLGTSDTEPRHVAPVEPLALLDSEVLVTLPEGLELGSLVHSPGVSDLQLVGPDVDQARIMAGLLPLPLAMQVDRMLHRIDRIDSAQLGAQPVWLVDGPTRISADDRQTDAETAPPARIVVPQFCSGALPSYVVAITAPTDDLLDSLTASLALSRPDGAEDCPNAASALRVTPPPEPVAAPAPATPPTSAEPVLLVGGQVTLTLAEGTTINTGARGRELTDVTLTGADGHLVRIVGGALPQSLDTMVGRLLHRVDAIEEVTLGAETLWVIHGNATRHPDNAEAPATSEVPARVLVPQFCTADEPSYVLALAAEEGNATALDPVIQSLTITRPPEAVDCTGGIETIALSAPAAPNQPQASTPLPEGWEQRERFGLRFALPEGGLVRLDSVEDGLMAYWVQYRNAETGSLAEFSLRIMGPEALAQMTRGAVPVDYPALLSQFSNRPILATGETRVQGDEVLSIYRNEPGEGAARVLYLIGEEPSSQGLTTWAVIASSGLTEDESREFETTVLANLRGSAVLTSAPATEPVAPVAPEPTPAQPEPLQPTPVQPAPPTRDSATPSTDSRQPTAPQVVAPAATPTPPPTPTQSPEALAWAEAQRQGTPAAVMAYLADWPRGLYSGEARAWLAARAIIAPATPTVTPAPPTAAQSADDRDWQAALARGTAEAFWDYLKAQQQGAHVADAYAQLTLLASRAPAPLVPPPTEPRK